MPFVFNRLALLMSIAAVAASYKLPAADKEAPFRAAPAASYPAHQTNAKVTIGVAPYDFEDKVKTAFGKLNPNRFGILPVLVVIQNDSGKAIRAERLKLEWIGPDRSRVSNTPPSEVRYLNGPRRPNVMSGPAGPKVLKRKNPLDSWEIEGRAFSARMIPAGESASGFFYFETNYHPGSRLYLSGLSEADSGNELFYFEIPVE
jgi:hypothetical protein